MPHRHSLYILLLIFASLSLPDSGIVNTVSAAQSNTKTEKNNLYMISGRVTDSITAAGFTYAEIDTGEEKVWTAAPGITPLKKGDTAAFSTEMPMRNYHSKTLGRDFSLIYFVKHYVTDKETSSTVASDRQNKQKKNKPITTYKGTPGEVMIGSYLREVTMTGINGENRKLSDLKGKPLIINVWASWCGPCRAEMGSLERLARLYNGKDFNVIGISTDDYHDRAVTFIDQTGITFDNYLDSKLKLENMLGANTIPLTILVDAQGRVLEKVRGAREWDSTEIIGAIGEVFHIKLTHPVQ